VLEEESLPPVQTIAGGYSGYDGEVTEVEINASEAKVSQQNLRLGVAWRVNCVARMVATAICARVGCLCRATPVRLYAFRRKLN
jgi:hypothetical protein